MSKKKYLLDDNLTTKPISTLRREKKMRDEKAKWGTTSRKSAASNKKKKDKPKKTNIEGKKNKVTAQKLQGLDLDVDVDEDSTIDDLYDILTALDEDLFDGIERETLKMIRKEMRVCMPRELGDWTTIKVDGKRECVHCNCNRCNFDGRCMWVSAFQSLQFGRVPDNLKGGEGLNWNSKILYGRRVFPTINIRLDVPK